MRKIFSKLSLGKKLVIIVALLVTMMGVLISVITINTAKDNVHKTMEDMSVVGVNTLISELTDLRNDLEWDTNYLANLPTVINAVKDKDIKAFENCWDNLDSLYFKDMDGNIIWQNGIAKNYVPKTGIAVREYADYEILKDNKFVIESSCPIYDGETQIGTVIMLHDLDDDNLLNKIKEMTSAEITIFLGNIRYATTIQGQKGTKMSDKVKNLVIGQSKIYTDRIQINGANYFSEYRPIVDNENKCIGAYFAGFPTVKSDEFINQMILVAVLITVGLIVVTILFILFSIKCIVINPLKATEKVVIDLSNGLLTTEDSKYIFNEDELGLFAMELTQAKHTLASYIEDISAITQAMAEGNFGKESELEYIGDFKQIKESFHSVTLELREIIKDITASSDEVTMGATQMAEGAQGLAEGTTKQATASDELVSTIADISNQVDSNAKVAKEVNQLAIKASEHIEEQNAEINNMLLAMSEINNKTEEINNIIKAIEDIAFQTNILALNAAIEAARAGEAGKGFGVVAEEVRNLATKSAESAESTKLLIEATNKAVKQGTDIAQQTAETMKIVKQIANDMIKLIKQISEASDNQAQAISQVSIGMEQIANVIQQNSATAEESAASCEELNGMAVTLKEQISKLRA